MFVLFEEFDHISILLITFESNINIVVVTVSVVAYERFVNLA